MGSARTKRMSPTTWSSDLHQVSDSRARERISLQPLSDAQATHRDRTRPLPHRAPDQNLVPEPPDEAEEGVARGEGDQRAGAEEER